MTTPRTAPLGVPAEALAAMLIAAHQADDILMTPGTGAGVEAIRAISTPVVATELRNLAAQLETLGDGLGVTTVLFGKHLDKLDFEVPIGIVDAPHQLAIGENLAYSIG